MRDFRRGLAMRLVSGVAKVFFFAVVMRRMIGR